MKKLKKERRVNLMKKTKLIVFFMLLGIGISFLIPIKVFAQITPDGNADDWYNYINQYKYGSASAEVIEGDYEKFYIMIISEPGDEVVSYYYEYDGRIYNNPDLIYFEPRLRDVIRNWIFDGFYFDFAYCIERDLGETNYDGYLYWNFLENYWQIDYYEITEENYLRQELEYYKQRVLVLEDLVTNLTNQLNSRNVQIQMLNGEINILLNEIRQLENALESEYDRGFTDGVLATESEAYEQGFRDGQKSKLAENNAAFYQGIEKWLVPAIITVIALGGFVTIAARKRRDE